ncbi:50S ribosomal protein L17 [Spirochaeta africana]|uniref:Large ribosomal subunit protein bL17 n=1 Tax=Spirochaeta africana (strain ATCC 700263 / DSM 8902 / Z-7692) TaxID=889378 RepID=H9UGN6_SPIAZ|nr:50S ribosomal protein L17 [Spirochaeta africana]AFG36679.1 ribosomal protein L17 [Spirochaeta africana DSM 8902]
MRHRVNYNPLSRTASHRKALHRSMVTSLFRHERIKTTKAKAKAIRRTAEKMITRAKVDSVHNRRMINRDIKDQEILNKLFTEIGPRFKQRPGGYTRILKLGPRPGDAAEMVLLELVQEELQEKPKKKKPAKKAAPKKADPKPDADEAAADAAAETAAAEEAADTAAAETAKTEDAAE